MSNSKILVVDDEDRMRKLLHDFLKKDGYEVLEAKDGEEALGVFYANADISLVILDVMMPKKDGVEVLREIRLTSDTPVILLTAKSDEVTALSGFDAGADEYVTKPFSPKVLVARVGALLKRAELEKGQTGSELAGVSHVLRAGSILVDEDAHSVSVDGETVTLAVKEFELLAYFIRNKGIALSREKILNAVWNYDYLGDARTIDTHVKKLRSKLGAAGSCIQTIWGMGYKFVDQA